MRPNAGLHSHSLAPPADNVEHAEPIGSRHYSYCTQFLPISVGILFSQVVHQRLTYAEVYTVYKEA